MQAEYDKFVAANGGKEYKARHILVETEDQAKKIMADLKKGAKFEDIAKKQSKDPGSGANGGDLDWANPASFVPEFSEAMIKLKKGETTPAPVKIAVRLPHHPRRRHPPGPAAEAGRSEAADHAATAAAAPAEVPGRPAGEGQGRVIAAGPARPVPPHFPKRAGLSPALLLWPQTTERIEIDADWKSALKKRGASLPIDRAGGVQQRQVVIVRGMGLRPIGPRLWKSGSAASSPFSDLAADDPVELDRPVVGLARAGVAARGAQVVHDVAAADDQHAALAQRPQLLAELVVLGRRAAVVHAELHHRDVGAREHRLEHRPGAVVEAPLGLVQAQRGAAERLAHALRDLRCRFRCAGRRVLLVEQLLEKPPKS